MKLQAVILSGFLTWMCGCYFDLVLSRYAYPLIIGGTIISTIGAVLWLRHKWNRSRLRNTFRVAKNFDEMTRQAFDFQWSPVSIMWTVCGFVAMGAVHLQSFIMKSNDAYACAVTAIGHNERIHNIIGATEGLTYIVTGHETSEGISEMRFGVIGAKNGIKIVALVYGHDGVYIAQEILIDE